MVTSRPTLQVGRRAVVEKEATNQCLPIDGHRLRI